MIALHDCDSAAHLLYDPNGQPVATRFRFGGRTFFPRPACQPYAAKYSLRPRLYLANMFGKCRPIRRQASFDFYII